MDHNQREIFKEIEGDQWFERNQDAIEKKNKETGLIISTLTDIEITPKRVLEIGCSFGANIDKINKVFGSECFGIDPSKKAIEYGKMKFPNISLQVATADFLPFNNNQFDMIIFGFCLYLCDRVDLFRIAYEADRCLSNKGNLMIIDFFPPFPCKNTYTHKENLFSFKMNYSSLFNWNPAYNEISNTVFSHYGFSNRDVPNEKVALTILNKSEECAYPTDPF